MQLTNIYTSAIVCVFITVATTAAAVIDIRIGMGWSV